MRKQVMLWLPVLHAGYERFLSAHDEADEILLLGESFADIAPEMKKEIRALPPDSAARYLRTRIRRPHIRVIETADLPGAITGPTLVMPDEELMRTVAAKYGLESRTRVKYEATFLRWDRPWSQATRPVDMSVAITSEELHQRLMGEAARASALSSDWWRQVGAVVARDGEPIITAYNRHQPTNYSPYINGDPRNAFRRGLRIELSTALHAEPACVALAAREGISLLGTDIYVTTFPCPGCARLIAAVGFRTCYFAGPYAMLDGEEVLRQAGVELVWVDMENPSS